MSKRANKHCQARGVSMPRELWTRARRQAERERRPLSWVVVDAVKKYLESEGTANGRQPT